MELSDAMLKHVWDMIEEMEPGSVVTIKTKKVAPNRPDLFVACAKRWIDIYKNGEFNPNYTKFKKTAPIVL